MKYALKTVEEKIDRDDAIRLYLAYKELGKLLAPIMRYRKKACFEVRVADLRAQVQGIRRQYMTEVCTVSRVVVTRFQKGYRPIESKRYKEDNTYLKWCLESLRESVRERRAYQKRYINDDPLIHKTPNHWFNESLKRAYGCKVPKDDRKYIGVELEILVPNDVSLEGLLVDYKKYISLANDGSIQDGGGFNGREVRILVARSEHKEVIEGVTAKLRGAGCKVNKSCGLHVHIDMRETTQEQRAIAFKNLYHSLGLLYTIVPESRRKNQYCRRNSNGDYQKQGHDRYKAVNVTAFRRHSTFEIRLFGGTIEGEKILNWISLLLHILSGETVNRCPKDFETAQKYYRYSNEVKEWAKARQVKFGTASTVTNEAQAEETQTEPALELAGIRGTLETNIVVIDDGENATRCAVHEANACELVTA